MIWLKSFIEFNFFLWTLLKPKLSWNVININLLGKKFFFSSWICNKKVLDFLIFWRLKNKGPARIFLNQRSLNNVKNLKLSKKYSLNCNIFSGFRYILLTLFSKEDRVLFYLCSTLQKILLCINCCKSCCNRGVLFVGKIL